MPHDIPKIPLKTQEREGRAPLAQVSYWVGRAECGQVVSPVIAGSFGGHDWDLVISDRKCLRCSKKVNTQQASAQTARSNRKEGS